VFQAQSIRTCSISLQFERIGGRFYPYKLNSSWIPSSSSLELVKPLRLGTSDSNGRTMLSTVTRISGLDLNSFCIDIIAVRFHGTISMWICDNSLRRKVRYKKTTNLNWHKFIHSQPKGMLNIKHIRGVEAEDKTLLVSCCCYLLSTFGRMAASAILKIARSGSHVDGQGFIIGASSSLPWPCLVGEKLEFF
jgi:hypothetical protein